MTEMVRCEAGIGLCGAVFTAPAPIDLRGDERICIIRRGWLSWEDKLLPCLIENMSTQGFLLMSNTTFPVDSVVGLRGEFYPDRFVECKIRIAHITDCCMGAQIVEMNAHSQSLCREFMCEYYSSTAFQAAARVHLQSGPDDLD